MGLFCLRSFFTILFRNKVFLHKCPNVTIVSYPQVSPVLHHKKPRSKNDDDNDTEDESDDCREKTNLFGVNFLVWFEVGIEGKDPMDQEEDDWGGKIEFGYVGKTFSNRHGGLFLAV